MKILKRCALLVVGLALLTAGNTIQQGNVRLERAPYAGLANLRAKELRQQIALAAPGDVIRVAAGLFNFGNTTLQFPPGVTIIGEGGDQTTFLSIKDNRVGGVSCAFEGPVSGTTTIRGVKFQHDFPLGNEGQCIGFGNGQGDKHPTLILEDFEVVGRVWPVYYWAKPGCTITLRRGTVRGAGTLLANFSSGGPNCYIDAYDLMLINDPTRVAAPGRGFQFPSSAFGVATGRTRADRCIVEMTGDSGVCKVLRLASVFNPHVEGGPPSVELYDVHNKFIPNGAVSCFDLDNQVYSGRPYGSFLHRGGSGSAPDGSFTEATEHWPTEYDKKPPPP